MRRASALDTARQRALKDLEVMGEPIDDEPDDQPDDGEGDSGGRDSATDIQPGDTEVGMATHPLDRQSIRRASDQPDPWLGRLIDGRYRVREVIGRGGMGMVYKVEHQRMGKIAAMKVLHREYTDDREIIERFRREAEAVSRLHHPNTVQVFDFGAARGALYLIMEYVRGKDLNTLIKRDGPMPFARAAPLLAQICGAVGEAHDLGIVHRDLKPENILVTRTHRGRDFVKVLDFGLAKLSEREERSDVTDRGSIVGTPYYMSPEQIRGEDVDVRTDVYSLGGLMYRVLTGHHAYQARTPVGVLTKHLTAKLIPPSERAPALEIAPEVDDLVVRAMAKDRDDRYASIGDVLDDIEAVFAHTSGESVSLLESGMARAVTSEVARDRRVAPAVPSDGIDYGIDSAMRLRRSDLDAFEASLRRRRRLGIALVPLLLAGAAAAAIYFLVLRPAPVYRAEREPNNQLDDATPVAADREVTGHLGRRISRTQPDVDYFAIALAPDSERALLVTAHVTALPNIDIELSLFNATGDLLARVDEGGVGHDEWLHRVRAGGRVYARVTEALPGPVRLPTENVSDTYALRVTAEDARPDRESEPNDTPGAALAIAPGARIEGFLDRRADVDVYRLDAAAGRYRIAVEGAIAGTMEVPVQIQLDGQPARAGREVIAELTSGAVFRLSRGDAGLDASQKLPGVTTPYVVSVTAVEPTPEVPTPVTP